MFKRTKAASDGVTDGVQQNVGAEWLRQEFDSSRPHGPDRHHCIAATRDEDNRHVNSIDSQVLLQIEPVEVRKTNIKYQATRSRDP
jgi:hypothetical protein